MTSSNVAQQNQGPRQKFTQFDKPKNFKVHHTKVNENKCNSVEVLII